MLVNVANDGIMAGDDLYHACLLIHFFSVTYVTRHVMNIECFITLNLLNLLNYSSSSLQSFQEAIINPLRIPLKHHKDS